MAKKLSKKQRVANASKLAEDYHTEKMFNDMSRVENTKKKTSNTTIEAFKRSAPESKNNRKEIDRVSNGGLVTYTEKTYPNTNKKNKKQSVKVILTPMGNKMK